MEFVILDLEWNQSTGMEEDKDSALPFEIIEIGAVKLNMKRTIIGEFHRIIHPVIYKQLHNVTKELIHISEEDLQNGVEFQTAAEEFINWCGSNVRFCTWGPSDLLELQRNMDYFGVKQNMEKPLYYYDVQYLFSLAYEEIMQQRTLEYAVHYLEIGLDGDFHSALYDAYYTAAVFKRINPNFAKKNFSVDTYCYPKTDEEEIKLIFSEHSLLVTKAYQTKEELKDNKEIMQINCIYCNKRMKRMIPWFMLNAKTMLCAVNCKDHGYFKGKLSIKNPSENVYYGIRSIKKITDEELEEIAKRKEDKKGRKKNKQKE